MRRALFLMVAAAVFTAMASAVLIKALSERADAGGGWSGNQVQVRAYEVQAQTFTDIVEALGTAGANESVTITAKVSDVIARLEFDSGEQVAAGQILAELADAEEAADLREARATLRETTRDVERVEGLTERGVAPASRLDEAIAENERARARVTAIEARLADRIIRAPFSGVIGLRNVSVGELVRPGDIIAQLDDSSIIKLDFTVPERFLAVISDGLQVQAVSAAFPDEIFRGVVDQVDTRIDPVTRTVTVRALIDNADGRLRPGMLMTVEMQRDERVRPAVPGAALVRIGEQTYVYAIEEGERGAVARRRNVTLGLRVAGMVEVLDGLSIGDLIVAEGVHRVREGGFVNVTEPIRLHRTGGAGLNAGEAAR